MNNAILIQQIYPDTEGVKLLELTKVRHAAYCEKHNIDYESVIDKVNDRDPKLGSFAKIELIKRAMLKGYEFIIWLDADTLIKDMDADLRQPIEDDKIGACWQRIPQLQHWNVGALYIQNSADTYVFIDEWLKVYPPPKDGWNEQGVFNRMAMASKVVVTISDKWNATLNYSMCPDAVVLGYHGYGTTQERFDAMHNTLKSLEAREGKR